MERMTVEQALAELERMRDEFGGLPHSLGYEFTHLPKANQALATLRAELNRLRADAGRLDYIERAEVLLCGIGGSLNNKAARANESVRDELATYATEVWYERNLEAVANWYERQRENAA